MGLTATLFPFLDVPVFWPILFLYWLALATFTLRRQIKHMIKHRYVPFDFGKPSVRSDTHLLCFGVDALLLHHRVMTRSPVALPAIAHNLRLSLQTVY